MDVDGRRTTVTTMYTSLPLCVNVCEHQWQYT